MMKTYPCFNKSQVHANEKTRSLALYRGAFNYTVKDANTTNQSELEPETWDRCQTRENMRLVLSAGKHETGAKP